MVHLKSSQYPKKSSQLRLFSRDKSFEIILVLVLLKNAMVKTKILTQEIHKLPLPHCNDSKVLERKVQN